MSVIIRRFLELLATCVSMSAFIGVLVVSGFISDTRGQCGVMLLIAGAVFYGLNIYTFRGLYYHLRRRKIFYLLSFSSYALFMLTNFCVYCFAGTVGYGFTFGITKFISPMIIMNEELGNYISVGAFHLLSLLIITITPFRMQWVKQLADRESAERRAFREIMMDSTIDDEMFEQAVQQNNTEKN